MQILTELFSLEGKTVLITGGARGIGKTVGEGLAKAGANVVIFDINGEQADATAKEIAKNTGRKTFSQKVDVTNYQEIQQALERSIHEMGSIELLFNNAGIVIQKPVIEAAPEEWKRVIDVNLNGVYYVAQLFGKYLVENKIKGAIVNTASMSGIIVNYPQLQASYNTSKAGVTHLTKSLAYEWAQYGIRVNCISPGYMFTELTSFVREDWREQWATLTPMQRLGDPAELMGAVIYLLSDAASFTTGSELVIDGGFTII
ncbi:glucose 1-dehydrogenase [Lysinibacillus macroides]|uniref:Short-chain dehydrogenase n=1 Tax=Lysinibacillus macroides TaxID=33935 RepID=A0A0N0UX50_9BACI|nr:glucose 1-dehydrogenase [Lysinibacillus macroides]KOY82911.1 short-chain dehydrogenase [Lysinibacillus macroides]QPR70236.1 glucose 1-dehydrogenase [Lysinibacillus macroides]